MNRLKCPSYVFLYCRNKQLGDAKCDQKLRNTIWKCYDNHRWYSVHTLRMDSRKYRQLKHHRFLLS